MPGLYKAVQFCKYAINLKIIFIFFDTKNADAILIELEYNSASFSYISLLFVN